jgi:hypothetical protein
VHFLSHVDVLWFDDKDKALIVAVRALNTAPRAGHSSCHVIVGRHYLISCCCSDKARQRTCCTPVTLSAYKDLRGACRKVEAKMPARVHLRPDVKLLANSKRTKRCCMEGKETLFQKLEPFGEGLRKLQFLPMTIC